MKWFFFSKIFYNDEEDDVIIYVLSKITFAIIIRVDFFSIFYTLT